MLNKTMLSSVVCLILGFGLAYLIFDGDTDTDRSPLAREVIIDTVFKEVRSAPIVLTKIIPKIIYKHDTVVCSRPYQAVIDTILEMDSIKAEYSFPENLFSLRITTQPDTLEYFNTKTIDIYQAEQEWWEVPAYILGGLALGYLIGDSK